jgi:hypothetical protein
LLSLTAACAVLIMISPVMAIGQGSLSAAGHGTETARIAARELMSSVRGLLAKALAQGGPAAAIHICSDSAQVVGERLSKMHALSIRRVSERWRNVKDAPDSFETMQLQRFSKLIRGGVSADSLESAEVVLEDSARVLRYMKPILVGEMCLNCHGDAANMKAPVVEALRSRYPGDQALGYSKGDLRGAVSVKVPL